MLLKAILQILVKKDLAEIIKFTQLFTSIKLPKNFNQVVKECLESPLQYNKKWYCQTCQKYVELETSFQRVCGDCQTR